MIYASKNIQNSMKKERVYKGRVVFGGHDVRQQEGLQVLFNDGGPGASFISASKADDAVSLEPGCSGEQADAPMAYTQAVLGAEALGTKAETWIPLPKHAWPDEWKKVGYVDPVCPFRLSLYGHPMAGVHWERHCHARLKEAGFQPIPGWECLFVHWDLQVMLSVYVADFKMADKTENIPKACAKIQDSYIKLDKIPPFDHYLGGGQKPTKITHKDAEERLTNIATHRPESRNEHREAAQTHDIKSVRYDMSGFFDQCIRR